MIEIRERSIRRRMHRVIAALVLAAITVIGATFGLLSAYAPQLVESVGTGISAASAAAATGGSFLARHLLRR
jgi:hypothetical protein